MSNQRASQGGDVGEDRDVVRTYLRQMGKLPRLTYEEEVFHARQFYQARTELGEFLCRFPWVLQGRIAQARANELTLVQDDGDDAIDKVPLEEKRKRITAMSEAFSQLGTRLQELRHDESGQAGETRLLLHRSLERLMSQVHFNCRFYQDCVEELQHLEQALTARGATVAATRSVANGGGVDEAVPLTVQECETRLALPANAFLAVYPEIRNAYDRLDTARQALLEGNLRLVISVAKKYMNYGLQFLDLIQEGNIGLMQAVDKFEPRLGHRFSTYAVWWVRQTITQALSSHSRTIRIPANMARALNKINRAEETLLQELGQEPTPEEISERVDMPVERVRALRKMERQTISLQSPVDNDETMKISDLIVDENSPSPSDVASGVMLIETINVVLDTLNDREREIIIHRFGLLNKQQMTLEELSSRFHVTHERIRQIEAVALKKLRHPSRRKYFEGYF